MINNAAMTNKEIVQDLLRRMPDDASLHDIAQELEFMAAVQDGLSTLDDSKDSISIEKVERQLPSWIVTIGRHRKGRQKRKAGDSLKSPARKQIQEDALLRSKRSTSQ